MSAAQLVWATWHHVPFDNAAMTNAVVALHRADPDAEIASLRAENAALLAALKLTVELYLPKGGKLRRDLDAAIAKAEVAT